MSLKIKVLQNFTNCTMGLPSMVECLQTVHGIFYGRSSMCLDKRFIFRKFTLGGYRRSHQKSIILLQRTYNNVRFMRNGRRKILVNLQRWASFSLFRFHRYTAWILSSISAWGIPPEKSKLSALTASSEISRIHLKMTPALWNNGPLQNKYNAYTTRPTILCHKMFRRMNPSYCCICSECWGLLYSRVHTEFDFQCSPYLLTFSSFPSVS